MKITTEEFDECIFFLKSEGFSFAKIATELRTSPVTVSGWKHKKAQAPIGLKYLKLYIEQKKENKRLEKENQSLKELLKDTIELE